MAAWISLTYDGGLIGHREDVAPTLSSLGLLASFFAELPVYLQNLPAWRSIAFAGHEVGNGNLLGAALPDGSLPAFTPAMVVAELEEGLAGLEECIPGQPQPAVALPRGSARCVAGVDYLPDIQAKFSTIRTGRSGTNAQDSSALGALLSIATDDLSGDQLIELARAAVRDQRWIVLVTGGVGVGEVGIDRSAHDDLCKYLVANRDTCIVRPIRDFAHQLVPQKPRLRIL